MVAVKSVLQLKVLDQAIEARVSGCLETKPDWPCRKGCDYCCRHLAAIPEVSVVEWERVKLAVSSLPEAVSLQIDERINTLRNASRPIVCPFLDRESGSCTVYETVPSIAAPTASL